jgi:hypothetical protein
MSNNIWIFHFIKDWNSQYKPYSKGVVSSGAAATGQSPFQNVASQLNQVTKKLDDTQIDSSSGAQPKEMVYNMDTGEMTEKKPALQAINEGEEEGD